MRENASDAKADFSILADSVKSYCVNDVRWLAKVKAQDLLPDWK